MPCPRCEGVDLWDDNLWWGCGTCGFAANEQGPTMIFAHAVPGRPDLPNTAEEVNRRAGLTLADYLPRLVPSGAADPHEIRAEPGCD